jgi:hypothetical protein
MSEDRKTRNHVFNVRNKKEKFYVVVKIPKDDVEVEVEWDRWIKMSEADKRSL